MDYTPNFHLPQWEKDDRVMMEDFNQMASDLEAALLQNRQAAQNAQEGVQEAQTAARQGDAALAQKDAELAAKDAELARLIAAAQQAADAAQTAANAAQAGVNQNKTELGSRLRISGGNYQGKGGSQTFQTAFTPMFVAIYGGPKASDGTTQVGNRQYSGYLMMGGIAPYGEVDWNAFTVRDTTLADYPSLNRVGCVYYYIIVHP